MSFQSFEERLENWGRVVKYSGGGDDACALWAKWYVILRDLGKNDPRVVVVKNELDGWLIEKAWRSMPNHVAKWLLKYHYVWNMGPDQLRTRMWQRHGARVRRETMEVSIANARHALAKEVTKLTQEKISGADKETTCKPEELFI